MSVLSLLDPDYLTTQMGKWFKLDEALAWCVTFRLIRPSQQIRELSVFNGAKENAEDAETPRTQRVGVSLH